MKKLLKALIAVFAVVVLAGCSKVSEKYAEDIRVAEAKGEHMTYGEIYEDLGAPHEEWNLLLVKFSKWYKGYDSKEEAKAAIEAGKEVAYITVSFDSNNRAIDAEYGVAKKETEEGK